MTTNVSAFMGSAYVQGKGRAIFFEGKERLRGGGRRRRVEDMSETTKQPEERRHRSVRRNHPDLPGAERVQSSPWRVLAVAAVALLAMLVGLRLAVKYAERDWAEKNAAAHQTGGRARGADAAGDEGDAAENAAEGWTYTVERRGALGLRAAERPAGGRASWTAAARAAAREGDGRAARMAARMATARGGGWATTANLEGTLALEAGRSEEARRLFRGAAGENRSAAYNLAVCDWLEGRRSEAIAGMAAFSMRRDADEGAVRTLGRWLWQSGRRGEAVEMLRRRTGDGSPLLLDLATYEAVRGEKRRAVATLRRALDGVPLTQAIHTFQSPAFREASLTEEGRSLLGELADRARQTLAAEPRGEQSPEPGVRGYGGGGAVLRR
jgi:hypothetical protein